LKRVAAKPFQEIKQKKINTISQLIVMVEKIKNMKNTERQNILRQNNISSYGLNKNYFLVKLKIGCLSTRLISEAKYFLRPAATHTACC